MTRRGFVSLALCLTLAAVPAFGQYCSATHSGGSCGIDEYISNVAIGTLNNGSACNASPHYVDYTSLGGTNLATGVGAPITVTIGTFWSGDEVDVFCDWNGNGFLNDAGEVTTLAGGASKTGTITPPVGAASLCLMRVRLRYFGAADPCNDLGFGDTEDYLVSTSCAASHTSGICGTDEYISNVSIGTLNNASACNATPHYVDFTGLGPTTLTAGGSYPITVSIGTFWSSDAVDVYCDWNHNGTLNDAGEATALAGTTVQTGNINVPANAFGVTLMRVRLRYGGVGNPCGNLGYGDTEDYRIFVGDPPCALLFTSPYGPGSIMMENTVCAPAAGLDYLNALVVVPGSTPFGWFFGLDIPLNQLVGELQGGYPFSGTLDGNGYSSFLVPGGLPNGLQLWAVSTQFTPGFGSYVANRGLVTYTIP